LIMRVRLKLSAIWLLVAGCVVEEGEHHDLDAQIANLRKSAKSTVQPLPSVPQAVRVNYTALTLRSPFVSLSVATEKDQLSGAVALPPDLLRSPEPLEFFKYSSLSMVGALSLGQQRWALIKDGEGGIHRVAKGNYIGQNLGEITQIDNAQLKFVETVPNGSGGWTSRARLLLMTEE
jgi:type IV pilus assembly protein PilP